MGDHIKKLLEATEELKTSKKLDLLRDTSATCESKFLRCTLCLVFPPTYFCPKCLQSKHCHN